MEPILTTHLGELYEGDCLRVLQKLPAESVDLAFADPPFNLGKQYTSNINDDREVHEYLGWCESWLIEMVRTLKTGGSLFLWNLPKWNVPLGAFLSRQITFRNWISVDIKYSLPIAGRLYPSHYSLLYFVKGSKPAIFHPDRLPVPCCRHCGGELPDYGGYKDKMNPKGVSMTDVWTDIPPVRHAKHKRRNANALSLKLMDRILSLASDPESTILDPFGGSGTTYIAAELTGRRWIGCELECSDIVSRFNAIQSDQEHLTQIHRHKNILFTATDLIKRRKSGRPLSSKYRVDEILETCACQDRKSEQTDLF